MHGVGISSGIAIGYAHMISHEMTDVVHVTLPPTAIRQEISRFEHAVKIVQDELEQLRASIPSSAPAEVSAFLSVHHMILNDAMLAEVPKQLIRSQHCNAEWALKQQMDSLLAQFDEIEDGYLRERKFDITQVVERVLKALLGHPSRLGERPRENSILVAHDLSPADMILFKQDQFAAFITDVGGATSHTAILARSLSIPSIVALHHARQLIDEHDLLIIDGGQGVVIVNPDGQILQEYRLRQNQLTLERQKLKRLRSAPAITLDGTPVALLANIELSADIAQVKESSAVGIGLFRSEFLFLNREGLPSEDEQFDAYRKVAKEMHGLPVTIRTLDLGADKQLRGAAASGDNPALGLRAIRLCLAEPQLFHTQLRAILRASHYGKVAILIPMLSSVSELNQTRILIEHAKESLRQENIPFDTNIQVGGMVEVPAAALMVDQLVKKLDFLSIGTNDLIQYTLAIDRADENVAHLYDPLHPAVLQLIAHTIQVADCFSMPVSVCGEMAGDPMLTRMLLGFGLRQFSMHPIHVLGVKHQILRTSLPEVKSLANKLLKTTDPEKIQGLMARINT